MKQEEFLNLHWKYYLNLESDFLSTIRFVSLEKENKKTFSIEFIKQYLTICSEINVFLNKMTGKDYIDDYVNFICNDDFYKKIIDEIVVVNLSDWDIKPYSLIIDKMGKKPKDFNKKNWWKLYNKVKHERIEYYKYANLENVLASLAALYVIEVYYFKNNYFDKEISEISVPVPKSKIFSCKNLKDNVTENFNFITVDEW